MCMYAHKIADDITTILSTILVNAHTRVYN